MAFIQYRFSSEKAGFRELQFDGEAISVADLKVLIAGKSGLSKEFARKLDLKLFHENELQEYEDDCQMIHAYTKVVVQRTSWVPHQEIQHQARTALTSEEWKTAEERKLQVKKKSFPPEFLCRLCSFAIKQPMLVKCTGNCGLSACRDCIQKHLQSSKTCPFCRSGFRAVIRNKRLEQLLDNLNLDEFDCPQRPADFESNESQESYDNNLLENDALSQNITSKDGALSTSASQPSYFMYLLNNTSLNLLRRYDMIVVEFLSNLASTLFNNEPSQDVFIIPCAAAGGGTSYAIGGFVRVSPLQRVDSAIDPIVEELMKKWENDVGKTGAAQGSCLYRVNWLEKYGQMPMLPSRKQPLYGLLGNHRRQQSFTNCNRLQLSGALEILLEKSKYEEVRTCIQDYIKFGSRPSEPFQYPSGKTINYNYSCVNEGPDDSGQRKNLSKSRESLSKNFHEYQRSPTRGSTSHSRRSRARSARLNHHTCSDSVSSHSSDKSFRANSSSYSPSSSQAFKRANGTLLGPAPMGLDGTIDLLNPYIGYCAILPFLTKAQFKHVKKLQKKAKMVAESCPTGQDSFLRRSTSKRMSGRMEEYSDDSDSFSKFSDSSDSNSESSSCSFTSSSRSSRSDFSSRSSSRTPKSETSKNLRMSMSVNKFITDEPCSSSSLNVNNSDTATIVQHSTADDNGNMGSLFQVSSGSRLESALSTSLLCQSYSLQKKSFASLQRSSNHIDVLSKEEKNVYVPSHAPHADFALSETSGGDNSVLLSSAQPPSDTPSLSPSNNKLLSTEDKHMKSKGQEEQVTYNDCTKDKSTGAVRRLNILKTKLSLKRNITAGSFAFSKKPKTSMFNL